MTTNTTREVTPQQKIALLKHLAGGKTLEVVADILRLPREQILDVASNHGYPDPTKMNWAVDVLVDKQLQADKDTIPTGTPHRVGVNVTSAIDTHKPAAPTTAAAPLTKPDEIRILLNTAKSHPSKRIQNAADRVFDHLDRLRTLIRDDEEKHSAARKAAEERARAKQAEQAAKAALKAEVAQLEQELREKKAKLRGKKPMPATPDGMVAFEKPKTTTAPRGEYPCRNDGCDQVITTPQGRGLHERQHCAHRTEVAAS